MSHVVTRISPARWSRRLVCAASAVCLAGAMPFFEADAATEPPLGWQEPPVRVVETPAAAGTPFGSVAAIAGNVMVVGVPSDRCGIDCPSSDTSKLRSGAAYVIRAPDGDWANYVVDLYLKEPPGSGGPAALHDFGNAVAIDGPRIAISMRPTTTGRTAFPGKVFVYFNPGANLDDWSGVSSTVPADTITDPKWNAKDKTYDHFGFSLAISGHNLFVGDVGDDGKNETAGSEATPLVTNSGAVSVYYDASDDGTGYPASVPNLKLKQRTDAGALAVSANAQFGNSIAFSGNSLIVSTAASTNKVTIYTSTSPSFTEPYNFATGTIAVKALDTLAGVNQESGDNFGSSVDIDGATAIVGAPNEDSSSEAYPPDNGSVDSGAAYVFHSAGGNADWSNTALAARLKQRSDGGAADSTAIRASNNFGTGVAIRGAMIAVGANDSNVSDGQAANGQGVVSLFAIAGGVWNWHSNLAAPELDAASPYDRFGSVVKLDDSWDSFRCFVSAPFDDVNGETSSGSIYVFQGY